MLERSSSGTTATVIKHEGTPEMEFIKRDGMKIESFRGSSESLGGDGEWLSTACRLKSGEVIYVPEKRAGAK